MTGRLFLFLGAAGVFIITAGVYVAATDNGFSSISNLVANFGAVLGISSQNNGELVAVIPLNKFDKESAVVAVKIQNNKSSKPEPKKTETTTAIVSSSEAPVEQNINIENQQLIPEEQPQSVTAPEPASQEPTPQLESAPIPASEPTQQPEPIKVLISEILFNVDGSDSGKEFIELYNPTNQKIDLSNWSIQHISASGSLTKKNFESNDFIAAKSFFLIWLGNDSRADLTWLSGSLNNTSATLYLVNNTQAVSNTNPTAVDIVFYDVNQLLNFTAGNSLERKALINSVCVSAQNENELKGNGCDTDNASDFELREMPNPQNTFDAAE